MKCNSTILSTLTGILLLPGLLSPAFAQSAGTVSPHASSTNADPAEPRFNIAYIHPSTDSNTTSMSGGWLEGSHYNVQHATVVQLISKAYGFQVRKILGGPSWLDSDRYDIIAQAPASTSDDDIKRMLQNLLIDRFKLVVHIENRPLPAYRITATKGSSKLKRSDDSGNPGCKSLQPADATPDPGTPVAFSCRAESMAAFAEFFYGIMWNPNQKSVDATGLKGLWDFDFKVLYPPRTADEASHNFIAMQDQLGLKIEDGTAPLPALIVDGANETPTPNPPGAAAALAPPPPPPVPVFDEISIKRSSPDTKELGGNIGGGQINLTGVTIQFLVNFALTLNDQTITNAPKWLDQDKFDIVAKVPQPSTATGSASVPPFDDSVLPQMVQKLLKDRFAMKWHTEDRPADAYVLLSVNPKMKKADPLYHSSCQEGPAPDGKDPRIANPVLGRLTSCQNTTMAQFAQELPGRSTGYIKTAVFNETGLAGAYDFVLSYSGYSQSGGLNEWSRKPDGPTTEHLAAPAGGVLLFDAIEQQLGLKLEKQKRPMPMVVLDHIDEVPTER